MFPHRTGLNAREVQGGRLKIDYGFLHAWVRTPLQAIDVAMFPTFCPYRISHKAIHIDCRYFRAMAEWSRRSIRNRLGSARVSSNLTGVVLHSMRCCRIFYFIGFSFLLFLSKTKGPIGIWTRIGGFRVLSDDHYTIRPTQSENNRQFSLLPLNFTPGENK